MGEHLILYGRKRGGKGGVKKMNKGPQKKGRGKTNDLVREKVIGKKKNFSGRKQVDAPLKREDWGMKKKVQCSRKNRETCASTEPSERSPTRQR